MGAVHPGSFVRAFAEQGCNARLFDAGEVNLVIVEGGDAAPV
jgi:hypothetical protein